MSKQEFYIKENSWLAKLAALKLNTNSVAIVLGKTIHLYGSTKENFLADERWLRHEICHIRQFKTNGFLPFIIMYLWESCRVGYYNNKFEVAARLAENA